MSIKMKRFLGILLSLALVLGLMPRMSLTAYADGTPVASVTPSGGTATNYTDFAAAVSAWTYGSTLSDWNNKTREKIIRGQCWPLERRFFYVA